MFPNKSVIQALFETYFHIRKTTWSLVVDEKFSLPEESSTPMNKITTCLNLLTELDKVKNTVSSWLEFVDKLINAMREESPTLANRVGLSRAHLTDTLRAAISYIISSVKDKDHFKEAQDTLLREILTEENAERSAAGLRDKLKLYTLSDFHIEYFKNTIKLEDPIATLLKEESFEDYVKNIADKARNTTLIENIHEAVQLRKKEKTKLDEAKSTDSQVKTEKGSPLANHSAFKKPPVIKPDEAIAKQVSNEVRRRRSANVI